ncbi:hypothetical protein [Nocardia sp. NPDC004711]
MGEVEASGRTFIGKAPAVTGLAGAGMPGLQACGTGNGASTSNGRTVVNLWLGSGAEPCVSTTQQLADAFTTINPNIEIEIRTFTGYFALLQAVQVGTPFALYDPMVYYNADLPAAAKIKSVTGLQAIGLKQFPGDNYVLQAMVESNGGSVLGCSSGHYATGPARSESIQAVEFMAQMTRNTGSVLVGGQ